MDLRNWLVKIGKEDILIEWTAEYLYVSGMENIESYQIG